MNMQEDLHLSEKRLLCAIVEESDLSPPERDHLSNCLACRTEKERLEQSLRQMSRMAERSVPAPLRKVVIPFEKADQSWWRRFWFSERKWTLAAGFTAAVAVVIIALGSVFLSARQDNARTAVLYREMQDDERLITEVGRLEEKSALPSLYIDISEGAERDGDDSFNESTVRQPERLTELDGSHPLWMDEKLC